MLPIEQLPIIYSHFRARYTERDARMDKIDQIVRGDFDQVDPDEDPVSSRSPNLIQVALEDTAEAAAIMPTVRVAPFATNDRAKTQAGKQEQVATGYFDASQMDTRIIETVMDLAGTGIAAWMVYPDSDQQLPLIEWRDPRTCYPEPGFRPGQKVRKCMFARLMHMSQLSGEHREKVIAQVDNDRVKDLMTRVTVVEYVDCEETVVGVLYEAGTMADNMYIPVELERIPNLTGVCPAIIGSRITFDREARGQFDQVIGVQLAHVRLMGMVLDYADQAVYSDIWVKDLIGDMPYGGGAYIELGPAGAIGRVPPAVTSLTVSQDLDKLVDSLHVGGRWPKSRPGEIDQSIASAKFIEAAAGMMNTAIKTYHQILKRMMEQALNVCFIMDAKFFPGEKTISGVLHNQEFLVAYDATKDIDLRNKVRVEYGLGLGRDPAQSAVLMLQYAQNGYISKEFVQENIDGLVDVSRERSRLDVEKFRDMALARLLQGLQEKSIPDSALVEIAAAREKGEDLFTLYKKYIIAPASEQQANQIGSGLGGPMLPGPVGPNGVPASPPGPQPPGPSLPVAPPPAPDGNSLLQRLGTPAGPGGLLGVQGLQK